MLTQEQARQMVEKKVAALYQILQAGFDVSPGQHIRLEGQIELLLTLQLIEWPWLEQCVSSYYQQYFQQALLPDYWKWMRSEESFFLPIKMWQAPVYKC